MNRSVVIHHSSAWWRSQRACGPQKLELYAVQGVSRLQSHSRMAHTALDISPRSRHNKSVEP
jgi:hypothetical protein